MASIAPPVFVPPHSYGGEKGNEVIISIMLPPLNPINGEVPALMRAVIKSLLENALMLALTGS